MADEHAGVRPKHEVRVHIDQKPFHSPNPTTGDALYHLGAIPAGLELFREVSGNHEDRPVPRGAEVIHLREDEHFHSGKPTDITIIVNGEKKEVEGTEISYAQVVALALNPVPTGPFIVITVDYRHGPHENPKGDLLPGGVVKIKNRMIFNVKPTDKS